MTGYLLRRLLQVVPLALIVVTLVFSLLHLIPGDPVAIMLGEGARAADVEALRQRLGLDRPLHAQYLAFLGGLVRGDLGTSIVSGRPVVQVVVEHYPATLELALAAMAVAVALALPLGVMAALWQDRWVDHGSRFLALLGVSMPNFWLGPLLILLFSIYAGWFPVSGRGSLAHLVLPALTLGSALAGFLTRLVRSSLAQELHQPYLRTARAKGLPERTVVVRHALGNALIPVVTVLGLQFGALLTGAIITETVFSWPGLGRLLIQSIQARDYPVVQAGVLAMALTYVLVNLGTDLLYAWLDPRIRYE
jgi:peptide/nickel transport system permease protein